MYQGIKDLEREPQSLPSSATSLTNRRPGDTAISLEVTLPQPNSQEPRLERWIGGIFDWGRHKWVWGMTGRPIKYQGFSRQSKRDNEWHCIAMDPVFLYRWKSESCVKRKHFICEMPLRNIGAKPTDIYSKKRRKGNKKRRKERPKKYKEPNSIL